MQQLRRDLIDALTRLHGEFPVRVSLRVPGSGTMLAGVSGADVETIGLEDAAQGEWALHAAVYRARPDAGAAVTFRSRWTAMLAGLRVEMPAVFDEQARHLGARVPVLLPERGSLGAASVDSLRAGTCAFLLGQEALSLGFNKDRAVFNAELTQKCCQAYVLATLTGNPVGRIPFYVRYVAGRRLAADRKCAAAAWTRGEVPNSAGSY